MGNKKDLSAAEKSEIVQCLGQGMKTLDISRKLKRDHRTIKRCVADSEHRRVRADKGTLRKISARSMHRIKRTAAKIPLHSSKQIFEAADECRATLDGPDGWSSGWLVDVHPVPTRLRRQ
ncbi:unnamed protein product [Staurois parvus]|uniref:Transposase IS30-like HTH domain-containing protein n=1 Tax=Staurois parvus TaxID=386267 RepID=A0ABN9GHE0_9NEOB|nr:unnamed protein product [Staurois parvus]